ncbi:MAG TPA: hypothetical protein ENN99_15175 [Chloroflexi bacterium]|nr:hypothetical protein [Chloroflexota bacterium]
MWGIVALALLLRMGWPTLAAFKRDESTIVRQALSIAYEGNLPAAGVDTSMGAANLPLTLYLMAIPLRLWRDPVAAVLFTGLLNGLAVLACYGLGRVYFGPVVGLVSAFLFAVSPWAVVYGRQIWAQNLPLINVGFFAALFAALVQGKRWALVGAFAGLAALLGLHMGGLAFIPILGLSLLLYRKQVALRPLLVGSLVFTLAMSPYVIHDALHEWRSLRAFLTYAGEEAQFSWDALRYAFINTGSYGIHGMAGALWPDYMAGLPNLWWLNGVIIALLTAAILYSLIQIVRGPSERRRPLVLLLIWFIVPIAMQSRPTAPVYPFYFNVLYPVQFLLIAVLLGDILTRWQTPRLSWLGRGTSLATLLLVGGLLAWGIWQGAVIGRLLYFMDQHPSTGGYGIPLKYTRSAAQQALRLAEPSVAEIIVLGSGTDPAMHETPATFEALLFDHPHRFADGRWSLPVPDRSKVIYLVGPVPDDTETSSELTPVLRRLEGLAHVQPGPVVILPDGLSYRIFYRSGPDRQDVIAGLTPFPEAVPFANGTVFLGYHVPEAVQVGEKLDVWVAWWVRTLPPSGTRYHFFTHLVDGEEKLLSQQDGTGFPTSQWQAGDLVVEYFPLILASDIAAGRAQIWAGQYTYPAVVNVPVIDKAGNPVTDRVRLGESVEIAGQ